MAPAAVVETELQVFEHQLRRLAQPVIPDDGRIADADMFLLKDPTGKGRIAFALGLHAGDGNPAIDIAPHMQHGAVESQQ